MRGRVVVRSTIVSKKKIETYGYFQDGFSSKDNKKKMHFTKHTFQINVKYTDDNLVLQKLVRTCISIFGFFCSARP